MAIVAAYMTTQLPRGSADVPNNASGLGGSATNTLQPITYGGTISGMNYGPPSGGGGGGPVGYPIDSG